MFEKTIMNRVEAAEGLVILFLQSIEETSKSIKKKNYRAARTKLKKALSDLVNANTLSLYRRNKRFVKKFRTLSLFDDRIEDINKKIALFQAAHKALYPQIKKTIKTRNDEQFKEIFAEINFDYVKELLKLVKDIVEAIQAVPKIKEHAVDIVTMQGEFKPKGGPSEENVEVLDKQFMKLLKFAKANKEKFRGLVFSNISIISLLYIDFVDCMFINCKFKDIVPFKKLIGYRLHPNKFSLCKFEDCLFSNCHFEMDKGKGFDKCEFNKVKFTECCTEYGSFSEDNLEKQDTYVHANRFFCTDSKFTETTFSNWKMETGHWQQPSFLHFGEKTTLKNCVFTKLPDLRFRKDCHLSNVKFLQTGVEKGTLWFFKSTLENVTIAQAKFKLLKFNECDFTGSTDIFGGSCDTLFMKEAKIAWTEKPHTIRFAGFNMAKSEFNGTFEYMGFRNCNLGNVIAKFGYRMGTLTMNNVSFFNTKMIIGAKEAKFTKCRFSGSNLSESEFLQSIFTGCVFSNTNLTNTKTKTAGFQECHFYESPFSNSIIDGSTLIDCYFTETHFIDADLDRSTFISGHFSSCNLRGIKGVDENTFQHCEGLPKKHQ